MSVKYEILEDTLGTITKETSSKEEAYKAEINTLSQALGERQRDCDKMKEAFMMVRREEEKERLERMDIVNICQDLVEELNSTKNRVRFLEEEQHELQQGSRETISRLNSELEQAH